MNYSESYSTNASSGRCGHQSGGFSMLVCPTHHVSCPPKDRMLLGMAGTFPPPPGTSTTKDGMASPEVCPRRASMISIPFDRRGREGSSPPPHVDRDVGEGRGARLQDRAQLAVDPHRENHRDARADPDDLDVRDPAEPLENELEAWRGERERGAPRDDDVTDLLVPPEVK